MKKKFRIRQHDLSDCGAACLASVCAHYGYHVSIARIRQLAGTDQAGTTVFGILETAAKLGMKVKAVKTGMLHLSTITVPAIAHLNVRNTFTHFVVITNIGEECVSILDPATGKKNQISFVEFEKLWTGVLILMKPGDLFKTNKPVSDWKRILRTMTPHRKVLAAAVCCAVMYSLLGLSISFYVKEIVDTVLDRHDSGYLNLLTLLMMAILIIQLITGVAKSFMVLATSHRVNEKLILEYYRHLLHLPQFFFDKMRVGEMVSRINDAVTINVFVNEVVMNAAVDLLIVVFSVMLMFVYYWKLAILMMLLIPVYLLLLVLTNRVNGLWQRKIMESGAALDALFVQGLNAASTIKRLSMENFLFQKISIRFSHLLHISRKSARKHILIQSAADFSTRAFTVVVFWTGCYFVFSGHVTNGELLSFYALIAYFTAPVLNLLGANKGFRDASIAAERLFDIMDLDRETGGREFTTHGDIEFSDVSFRYAAGEEILKHVNLVIAKGTCTGITGQSGSGKTTLAALLLKLYEPSGGTICINGTNIRNLDKGSVRNMIASVPQHAEFIEGSILENILLDRPVDFDLMNDILKRIGFDNDLLHLPQGIHSPIAEQGANLSGGQKQKISIARALYRNAPVLIMDEPTSSLDKNSEQKIMQTIDWYKSRGNTVIIIAHNDSALKNCDNIVLLKSGSIVSVN